MKKFLLFLLLTLVVLVAILLFNAFQLSSKQYSLEADPAIPIEVGSIQKLSRAVTFKTISYDSEQSADSVEFQKLLTFLALQYPLCDSILNKEIVNSYSLIYRWQGKNLSLKPVILLAHLDVVPPEGGWEEDPFSGAVKDGFIWGRGTLDDKVSVLGILDAAEKLLANNFIPERTIYFAFGHDEETGGTRGANRISEWMKKKNIEAEFVLDEGLVITDGIVPGMDKPVALIGIAEKGYLTLQLSVQMNSGHSSMPEKETAIGVLSSAIHRLEKNKLEANLSGPAQKFLEHIGPEMGFFKKIVFANTWLFEKLIINTYEKTPAGNALIRTTLAPTIFSAGVKENVVPEKATAIINLRTLPQTTKEEIIQKLKDRIEDERVKIEIVNYNPSSEISSVESFGYKKIDSTIRKVFPDMFVAPSLMIAATDSKHYTEISKNIYRFLPIVFKKEDLEKIHGKNERISVEGYKDVIRFYHSLMKGL